MQCDIPDKEIPSADPEAVILQYTPLVKKLANRYKGILDMYPSVDLEDLHQAGFIAITRAQRQYDPNGGASFLTYIFPAVKHSMLRTLGVINGHIPERLISLDDTPTENAEDLSLLDTIEDTSIIPFDDSIIEHETQQETAAEVRGAVSRLKNPKHREIITRCWLDGQDRTEAAAEMGMSVPVLYACDQNARDKLRRDEQLKQYAIPFFHISVSRFKSTWTSAVEAAVLWREEKQKGWLSS